MSAGACRVVVPVASVARRGLLWHTINVAGEQIEMRAMLFVAALLVACAGNTESDAGVLTTEPKAPPDSPPGDDVPPSEPTEPPPAEVPEAPVDPYADCDASGSEYADGCTLERTCETGASHLTQCSRVQGDTWSCTCSDFYGQKAVRLSTKDPPCDQVAAACPTLEMPRFDGEPECRDDESSDVDWCAFDTTCVRSVPIDETFTAVETVSSAYVTCTAVGDGPHQCGCTGDAGGALEVDADLIQVSDACRFLMPGCSGEEGFRFGPWSCTPRSEGPTEDGCELVEDCVRVGMLGNVPVTRIDTTAVACHPSDSGRTLCGCATNWFGGAYIEMSQDPADGATCHLAFDRCRAGIELVGEESCEPASVTSWSETCTATMRCSHPAIAGGQDVVVTGSVWAECQLDGDLYACLCNGAGESDSLRVEAPSSESACTDALARCHDLVPTRYSPGIYQD